MAIETLTDRPPYVTWEFREVEDRNASQAAGSWRGKDVAYAIITRPGSKDDLHMVAEEWLAQLPKAAAAGTIPMSWGPHFRQQYEAWKSGATGEVTNGTPIRNLTVLGPAAQKMLISLGIVTIEDLAAIPDQDLQNVGTGAISYKMKAKAFLEAANGPGKMAEKFTALEVKLGELVALTANLTAENQKLRAQIPEPPKK